MPEKKCRERGLYLLHDVRKFENTSRGLGERMEERENGGIEMLMFVDFDKEHEKHVFNILCILCFSFMRVLTGGVKVMSLMGKKKLKSF